MSDMKPFFLIVLLKRLGLVLVSLVVLFALAVTIAKGPALSPKERPASALVTFPQRPQQLEYSATEPLRVATYNIGYASGNKNNLGAVLGKQEVLTNLERMGKALHALRPDILAIQEVDFQAARSFDIDQFEYLAKTLQMPYGATTTTWNLRYLPWPYWPPELHFGRIVSGQAVLSRYPIRSQTIHRFDKPRSNSPWYNWFYLERVAQELAIDVDGQTLSLWHIHLEAFDPKTRKLQAERLAMFIHADASPRKILLGDFNSVSQTRSDVLASDPIRYEENGEALTLILSQTGLKNAEPSGEAYTFPSWNPARKIDHILYSDALHLKKVEVLYDLLASDHLPVWAEFE